MSVLDTLYASGGNEIRLVTLDFSCPAWASSIRLVSGYESLSLKIEDGNTYEFIASDFGGSLPSRNTDGNQTMNLAIDPTATDAVAKIDSAMASNQKITVNYREYVRSDLDSVAMGPMTFTVVSAQHKSDESGESLVLSASFYDLTNRRWPRRRYTVQDYKGLKYYNG